VEEGLFFDGIAGEDTDVTEGDFKRAGIVESNAADAVAAGFDEAAMSAGEAANVAALLALDKRFCGGSDVLVEHVLEGFEAGLIV